jgi:hypothetical protein
MADVIDQEARDRAAGALALRRQKALDLFNRRGGVGVPPPAANALVPQPDPQFQVMPQQELAGANQQLDAEAEARAAPMRVYNDKMAAGIGEKEIQSKMRLDNRMGLYNRNDAQRQPFNPMIQGQAPGGIAATDIARRKLGDYQRFGAQNGVVLPITKPRIDPYADTPEDIQRKDAMSNEVHVGGDGGQRIYQRGAIPPEALAGLKAKALEDRKMQSDQARANVESGAAQDYREKAINDFNRKNAIRAFARGKLTPNALSLLQANGTIPKFNQDQVQGSAVAHLENIYGRGMVPPDAFNHAMEQDATTARAKLHTESQAADRAQADKHFMGNQQQTRELEMARQAETARMHTAEQEARRLQHEQQMAHLNTQDKTAAAANALNREALAGSRSAKESTAIAAAHEHFHENPTSTPTEALDAAGVPKDSPEREKFIAANKGIDTRTRLLNKYISGIEGGQTASPSDLGNRILEAGGITPQQSQRLGMAGISKEEVAKYLRAKNLSNQSSIGYTADKLGFMAPQAARAFLNNRLSSVVPKFARSAEQQKEHEAIQKALANLE